MKETDSVIHERDRCYIGEPRGNGRGATTTIMEEIVVRYTRKVVGTQKSPKEVEEEEEGEATTVAVEEEPVEGTATVEKDGETTAKKKRT